LAEVWGFPGDHSLFSTLDNIFAKFEELRETDPDVLEHQEKINSLRAELLFAKIESKK